MNSCCQKLIDDEQIFKDESNKWKSYMGDTLYEFNYCPTCGCNLMKCELCNKEKELKKAPYYLGFDLLCEDCMDLCQSQHYIQ